MAMMTTRKGAVREDAMVARNSQARKRPRPKKPPRPKCARGLRSAGCYERGGDLSALAARISATIEWTAGDTAMCFARQAGPGPRI
jgi:hypothetical protein